MFDILMNYVCIPFGYIMKLCWQLVGRSCEIVFNCFCCWIIFTWN